jgi:hypothetical protein
VHPARELIFLRSPILTTTPLRSLYRHAVYFSECIG